MTEQFRWGILSTGRIARKFADTILSMPDAALVAVGSRSQTAADEFGDSYNVPHRHASYEALAADPDVDAIYIATPHTLHMENALLCLDHGKHILVEKPFTMSAAQATAVIDRAREKRLFAMEALWTRFLPAMSRVRDIIAVGEIGDIRLLMVDFCFDAPFDPTSRLFDPAIGGGAVLDVGVYCLSFAAMLLGTPDRVNALATLGETGVDSYTTIQLSYSSGALASITCGNRVNTPIEALIAGSQGRIRIPTRWYRPHKIVLTRGDEPEQVIDVPYEGGGFQYQVAAAIAAICSGQLESPIMPLDDTYRVMQVLDEVRRQIGLVYPADRA
jgi:predicted dehydrogenase